MNTNSKITEYEFHQPDSRWVSFGYPTYESYLETFLIRGNFHSRVPEPVVKSFETVEYMMAHAYYHYPMYDQALNSTLLVVELAIKLKCKELSIPIANKNKTGKAIPVPLEQLVKKIHSTELSKELELDLVAFKELRNAMMHPERHSYMGGMSMAYIVRSVNLLNALFAPLSFYDLRNSLLATHKKDILRFQGKVMEMYWGDEKYIVQHIEITDLIVSNGATKVCVFVQNVPDWSEYTDTDQGFFPGCSFYLEEITLTETEVTGINITDGLPLRIFVSTNEDYISKTQQYLKYIDKHYKAPYDRVSGFIAGNKYRAVANFRQAFYPEIA